MRVFLCITLFLLLEPAMAEGTSTPANKAEVRMAASLRGGIIWNSALAEQMAELILRGLQGIDPDEQRPWTVSDLGDAWLVLGSGTATTRFMGGPWHITIRKADAEILGIGQYLLGPDGKPLSAQDAMDGKLNSLPSGRQP